ncbi:MAG: peptide deformylase [Lachnospiraceae bacterium]|nr:peptide deformylase [Lachnospiraceae bacterium]
MAIRNIRTEGDEILRKNSKVIKDITPRTDELIDDMIETLHEANGVGLAAVQVGVLKRLCIISIDPADLLPAEDEDEEGENGEEAAEIEIPEDFDMMHTDGEDIVVINPTIIVLDEEDKQTGNEGCLSVPGKFGCVTRPNHILLKAQDRNLKPYELEAKGLLARAICHECDHMDGIMYIDKVEGELHEANQPEQEEE